MAINPDDQPSGGGWRGIGDDETVTGARKRDRDVTPRMVVALVALVAAALFVFQNGNRVKTTFLVFEGRQPLWLVIVVSVVLGMLLGQALGLLRRRRKNDDD
ncbi:MAG TPA: LapA family protein [Acidimicrobiales bacterium]